MNTKLNPHYFIYNSDGICIGFNPYEEPFIEYEEVEEDEDHLINY